MDSTDFDNFIDFTVQGVYDDQNQLISIFYPGSNVPTWFTSRCYGSSIFFVVSCSKLTYLNTCVVYKLSISDKLQTLYMVITNKTKDKMIKYSPGCYGISEGDDEYMRWLSHWKFDSHELECGDEVCISIFTESYNDYSNFEVKEVGVDVVYQQEEEEEEEEEGIHPAKRLKVQQTCNQTSHCVIPMEQNPDVLSRFTNGIVHLQPIRLRPTS